jgi:hypothetical protein
MSIFRGLTLVIVNRTFVLLVAIHKRRVVTLPLVAKMQKEYHMSPTHPISMPAPLARSIAIAALMDATMLAAH